MNTTYIKNDRLGRITLEYMAQAKNFFVGIWENASDFFASYRWREMLFDLKTASIIISLVFLGLIIFLLVRMNAKGKMQRAALSEKSFSIESEKGKILKKWEKIEKKIISESPENYKLAVLEADEIFEEILKILGKAAEIRIMNMGEIEKAKEIKNKIIDISDFALNKEEATKAVKAYKGGLTDLKVV